MAQPQTALARLRLAIEEDVPWLLATAKAAYGEKLKDLVGAEAWVRTALHNPAIFMARGEHVFIVAILQRAFFDPTLEGYMPFLAGAETDPWEAIHLINAAAQWAKSQGASCFWIRFTNGLDAGPFAKRVGAQEAHATYVKRF